MAAPMGNDRELKWASQSPAPNMRGLKLNAVVVDVEVGEAASSQSPAPNMRGLKRC